MTAKNNRPDAPCDATHGQSGCPCSRQHPDLWEKRCVFCPIIEGDAPADFIERGEHHVALVPLGPHVPGHVLFVPTTHLPDASVNPMMAAEIFVQAARYVGDQGIDANIITSVGEAATQSVPHLHIHVIPRGADDKLPSRWPWIPDATDSRCDRGDPMTAENAAGAMTVEDVNALVGDDVAYWLSNPSMPPELLAEKVQWWISTAVAATQAEVANAYVQWAMKNEIAEPPLDWAWFGEISRRYSPLHEEREADHG